MPFAVRKEARLSVRFLWIFARVSRDPLRGREIFLREKIGPAQYFDPETRLGHSVVMDLLRRHVDAGDVDIGLRAGASVYPGDFAVLEYAARSCPTLGDAIRGFARYVGLLNEAIQLELLEDGEHFIWRQRVVDGVAQPPAANDFVLAAANTFAKTYCRVHEPPIEVHFAHPEPPYRALYDDVFGTKVRFGAADNAFVLSRKRLDAPLRSTDLGLRAEYEAHASELLANSRGSSGVTVAVRRMLLANLRTGSCSMATTARNLGMSEPTLRRRLDEEGATYATVLDEVRYDLARRYLADADVAGSDVAFLLGFKDASSFSKAFRRWTGGTTAAEYRLRAVDSARSVGDQHPSAAGTSDGEP
jgi:AraC-like DNA-binding protein